MRVEHGQIHGHVAIVSTRCLGYGAVRNITFASCGVLFTPWGLRPSNMMRHDTPEGQRILSPSLVDACLRKIPSNLVTKILNRQMKRWRRRSLLSNETSSCHRVGVLVWDVVLVTAYIHHAPLVALVWPPPFTADLNRWIRPPSTPRA